MALAVSFTFLLVLSAYAINLCYLQRTHGELGSAIDAAAAAAIDEYQQQKSQPTGRQVAQDIAEANTVQGEPLALDDDDIEFGHMTRGGEEGWQFSAGQSPINAVRVLGKVVSGDNPASKLLKLANQKSRFDLERWSIAMQNDRDIALVVDRSSAMAFPEDHLLPPLTLLDQLPAPPFTPLGWQWCMQAPLESRWVGVVLAIEFFLQELPQTGAQEQVGLVSFADSAVIELPLSVDFLPIVNRLLQLLQSFCGGLSDKEEGILKGIAVLQDPQTARPDAAKILILISGSPHDAGDALGAAQLAAQQGIQVHTISYGNEVDIDLMSDIAETGGGSHLNVTTRLELTAALRRLARDIPVTLISGE